MGCGSSSLKGDDVPAVNSNPVEAPIKKVQTNFSTVDYDQDTQNRRMTEVAPHETVKAKAMKKSVDATAAATAAPSEHFLADPGGDSSARKTATASHQAPGSSPGAAGPAPNGTAGEGEDMHLKPYQTLDAGDWDNDISPSGEAPPQAPLLREPDPTSSQSKDEFAAENDPSNRRQHQRRPKSNNLAPHDEPPEENGDGERKKSWLGQKYASLQTAKRGQGVSDEDLKAYTGKDRAEFEQWTKDNPDVGGGQASGRIGMDSAMVYGTGYSGASS